MARHEQTGGQLRDLVPGQHDVAHEASQQVGTGQ
jgi:hypothetical protein